MMSQMYAISRQLPMRIRPSVGEAASCLGKGRWLYEPTGSKDAAHRGFWGHVSIEGRSCGFYVQTLH